MKKAMIFGLAIAASPLTWAESLHIPFEFEFVAVDGKSVSSSLFSHKDELKLSAGTHKIALQYKDLVADDHGDGHTRVSSSPFVITLEVAQGEKYTLAPSTELTSLKIARDYAKAPQVEIHNRSGSKITFDLQHSEQKDRGVFGNLSDYSAKIAASGTTPAEAAAVAQTALGASAAAIAADAAVPASAPKSASSADPATADEMLKYWWSQADEQTRKAFMGWAVQQL